MTRRFALPAALTALACLLLYGFLFCGLFREPVWWPQGLVRLVWIAAMFAGWTAVGMFAFPRWYPSLTAAAILLYSMAAVGPLPVAAVVLFLVSAASLGGLLGLDGPLAIIAGLAVYTPLIGLMVRLPVNYRLVYAILFIIPIVVRTYRRRGMLTIRLLLPQWTLATALLVFVLLLHLLVALGPEVSADGLAVHLAIPASVAAHHQWTFDFHHTTWAVSPLGGDWCYTAAYLLGGEMAARLFNFGMLLLTSALLYQLLRRMLATTASVVLVTAFVSGPIVQLVTGSMFVENYWAALLLGAFTALVRYRETAGIRYAGLAAALAGTALTVKFGTFAFLIPFAALLIFELRRARALRFAPAIAAIVLLFGAEPYVRAYVQTGDPVYPNLNTVFKSPYFDSRTPFVDTRFERRLAPTTLYDLTFHTDQFLEGQAGGWNFQFLLLVPLAILFVRRNSGYPAKAALILGVTFAALTLAERANARYVYPALPFFVLSAAALGVRAGFRWMLAASVVLSALNVYFLPASGWYHREFAPDRLFHPSELDGYLRFYAPTRRLVDEFNRTSPGEPVLFVDTTNIAGLRATAYTTNWHTVAFFERLRSAETELDCLRLMNQLGIRRFIAPVDPSRIALVPLRRFMVTLTTLQSRIGDWQAARLRDRYGPGELVRTMDGLAPLSAGPHDDIELDIGYRGAWLSDRQFHEAGNGTITYSNSPGDRFRVTFEGTGLTWVFTKAFNRGKAEVIVDGRRVAVVDLYSPQVRWQSRASFDGLPRGRHVVEVRVLAEKNPAAQDRYVDVDLLIVQ